MNICGIKWVARLAIPVATASASLAFISSLAPILGGDVDWRQAFDYHLTTPFEGWFGDLTSVMAGLYLIGFAAPAFEAAACHVGETVDPNHNVPRAMLASAFMAGIYFIVLPVVWLGVLGPEPLGRDLATVLGPTFAPLLGSFGKAAAIWFIMFNMFHGTLQPLAGAARTMSQLTDDGLLPRFLSLTPQGYRLPVGGDRAYRLRRHHLPAGGRSGLDDRRRELHLSHRHLHAEHRGMAVAAGPARRDAPLPRAAGPIVLGVVAASIWLLAAILGFQQFGLPTVVFGLALAYSGAALYAWRVIEDRRAQGLPALAQTLHVKLTGAMVLVLVLDGIAYLLAVNTVADGAPRARVGAGGHLRGRGLAHHQRGPRPAGHDHLLGDRGQQGGEAA